MSNVVELISYRANRESVAQLNEVALHLSNKARKPMTKSETLRRIVADAHERIVRSAQPVEAE
jgi:hypothetical protein